jgi:hypothetical protein
MCTFNGSEKVKDCGKSTCSSSDSYTAPAPRPRMDASEDAA